MFADSLPVHVFEHGTAWPVVGPRPAKCRAKCEPPQHDIAPPARATARPAVRRRAQRRYGSARWPVTSVAYSPQRISQKVGSGARGAPQPGSAFTSMSTRERYTFGDSSAMTNPVNAPVRDMQSSSFPCRRRTSRVVFQSVPGGVFCGPSIGAFLNLASATCKRGRARPQRLHPLRPQLDDMLKGPVGREQLHVRRSSTNPVQREQFSRVAVVSRAAMAGSCRPRARTSRRGGRDGLGWWSCRQPESAAAAVNADPRRAGSRQVGARVRFCC